MSDELNNQLPPPPPPPVQTGVLGMLAQRRNQIIADQILPLEVPRWTNPRLVVKFHPIEHKDLRRGASYQEQVNKEKNSDKTAEAEINTSADVLVACCAEIVAVFDDGTELGMGPDGRRGTFDRDMAIALGMPENSTARAVCRATFVTSGDLLAMSRKLGEWSGYRDDVVEETLKGES